MPAESEGEGDQAAESEEAPAEGEMKPESLKMKAARFVKDAADRQIQKEQQEGEGTQGTEEQAATEPEQPKTDEKPEAKNQ